VGAAPQGIAYDAASGSLAVAVREPYRLLLLDPDTLTPRFSVPVPGKVRHLQVTTGGGFVLVPAETADKLLEVDTRTRHAQEVRVQRHPHDAAGVAGGDVVVADEFSGSISVVRHGEVVHTFSDLRQPGGVAVQGSTAVVVDVRAYTVSTYDLDSMRRVARVPAGAGPTHVALVGDDRLAVTDTRGGRVLLYSLDPLRQVGSVHVGGSPYGVAADPTTGTVWVTLTGRNELLGLRVAGDRLRRVASYPTVRQPDTVTVAPGSHRLWVTGTAAGVVEAITR
jgi:DNA-binding beta-propeller fold protein YncE